MKPYSILKLTCLLLLPLIFAACKKVINVNLNSTSPRYDVEGNVTNQPGPYLVAITKSVNFDQDNLYPAVSGAVVVITDVTANQADTLTETSAGNYNTHVITGTPGHTYQLYINAAGNIFTASSTMPSVVALDSLYTQPSPFGGSHPQLVPLYTDPVLIGHNYHYYHFTEYYNDTESSNVIVREDNLINGQVVKQPINGSELYAGDSVALYLECIDSGMYVFYTTLELTENQNSATPANPLTNLTGGALGYFSAHTSSLKTLIVQ
jgi:hypothetical protein